MNSGTNIYMDTPYLTPLVLFCVWWISSWGGKTHKFCRGPFNEYSYQVWFQFTQRFQRGRMKCKSLRTMTNRHKMMTKSHTNHWVRAELKKKERKSHICVNLLWTSYTWSIKHIDGCVLLSSINTNQQMQVFFFVKTFFCHHDNIPNPILWVSFIHEHKKKWCI